MSKFPKKPFPSGKKATALRADRLKRETALDEALDQSFPASDPVEMGHSEHTGSPKPERSATNSTVDHAKRKGAPYSAKGTISEEQRQQRSEAMKEFHRKTRKGTTIGNALVARARRPK